MVFLIQKYGLLGILGVLSRSGRNTGLLFLLGVWIDYYVYFSLDYYKYCTLHTGERIGHLEHRIIHKSGMEKRHHDNTSTLDSP